jgi:hypothetical protein
VGTSAVRSIVSQLQAPWAMLFRRFAAVLHDLQIPEFNKETLGQKTGGSHEAWVEP